MLRSRRVIALTVALAIGSLASAQTATPAPPAHPIRKPTTRPAAPEIPDTARTGGPENRGPGRPPGAAPHRPERPVRPDYHRGPTPATSQASNETAATQEVPRRASEVPLASRPAREPQVVEFEITSSEGDPWGRILIELYPERTPITARTFLQYVNSGFYDGTIFHRVIPSFVVQGGGYTSSNEKKTEGLGEAIRNESRRGTLRNARGMVAMARKQDPHSALCQFFINLADNEQLDYPRAGAYGYCVFAKVVEGMDVVDRIADVPTRVSEAAQRRFDRYTDEGRPVEKAEQSEPLSPPILKHARLLEQSELPPSVTSGPAGRAQPKVEQRRPESSPASEPVAQPGEEPTTEPVAESQSTPETPPPENPAAVETEPPAEPVPALEPTPSAEPGESAPADQKDNAQPKPARPAKQPPGPKKT